MSIPLFPLYEPRRMNRRSFLALGSLAAAAVWSNHAFGVVTKNPKFAAYPFQLGVASGDPTPEGVVLWTRLAPKPLEGGGLTDESIEVGWQIAEDEQMQKVVRQGTAVASSDWAHSVHVEVEGLKPDRWYWYQFKAGSEISQKGRTRTMPADNSSPNKLRFAFASCQHFETGYFTAYEHMVKEELDLVLHLGDYIYEYAGIEKRVRKHLGSECKSLADYRLRYSQYKSDVALQAMHAAAPWIVTPDDHEVENNYANDIPGKPSEPKEGFLLRRAAAYQAYYEHMPLRSSSIPKGPDIQLYRQLNFGQLANFFVLDTRQYRTDQPCGDGLKEPCAGATSPDGTILGPKQREWLFNGLGKSPTRWNVLAQQVMMARVDRKAGEAVGYSMDQWPGYEVDRRKVIKFLGERKISNPVVLAGDIHSNWANELITDFDNLESKSVATEFVGTSISSSGDGTNTPKSLATTYSENPFVKFHNAERGYVRCEITAKQWRTDYKTVEYVSKHGAPLNVRSSFVVESGQPKLQKA